ncbi:hypothetical protein [Nocardia otitidiscaviarum]|uniref:hypothetical protein n=1 Tax=Nocardia otitidiscaviarum TaxID=1823 RepID=UPI0024589B9B|nr:hypothetical protein [Nocardia otitidiscaviarum]
MSDCRTGAVLGQRYSRAVGFARTIRIAAVTGFAVAGLAATAKFAVAGLAVTARFAVVGFATVAGFAATA